MAILTVKQLKKTYGTEKSGNLTHALNQIDFQVNKGEFVAIMGESGSGKSTLLNITATLDKATSGEVILDGQNLGTIKEKEVATFRREKLGFVFQDFNLLDLFNNQDNILLPLVLSNTPVPKMEKRLNQIATLLGIQELLQKFPYEISGGQKQRVAIARAVITRPQLLFADEPTGALDSKSSRTIMQLFQGLHQQGQTIMMVTHSIKSAAYADRILFIKDGTLYHEIYKGSLSLLDFEYKIKEAIAILERKDLENEN